MDCKDCKRLLSRFLDNELDQKQLKLMTEHIEDCSACAQSLESITEMVNMMHKIKAINPPRNFIEKVNKRLDELPFGEKVLNSLRNLFFQHYPVKSFALLATLVLVFVLTSQLNKLPNRTKNSNGAIALKQQNSLGPAGDFGRGVASGKAVGIAIPLETLSEKVMLSSKYIKANAQQVLILSLDDQDDKMTVKEMLTALKVADLEVEDKDYAEIFTFKIAYDDFLKLHSSLAGKGQLEKATPDVELYENSEHSVVWQQEAFKQLISVELKVLK